MNRARQLTLLIVALFLIAYAVCATMRANRLEKCLAGLEASQRRMQEKHHQLMQAVSSLAQPRATDPALRAAMASLALNDRYGVDLDFPFPESATINRPRPNPIK